LILQKYGKNGFVIPKMKSKETKQNYESSLCLIKDIGNLNQSVHSNSDEKGARSLVIIDPLKEKEEEKEFKRDYSKRLIRWVNPHKADTNQQP
jgi:hypothetical protein